MAKSIMQDAKECYFCRLAHPEGDLTSYGLEEHHVMHGTANRHLAEKWGLKVWLCPDHHRTGRYAVHKCNNSDKGLKKQAQERFEEIYSYDKWMEIFGKDYR